MRGRLRLLLAVISIMSLFAALFPLTFAGAQVADESENMTRLFGSPRAGTNSDLAFWGDRAYVGNYEAFRIFDISDPTAPTLISETPCPGPQNDISVWDGDGDGSADLLFLSTDSPRTNDGCASAATRADNPDSWEGIKIFDISDEEAPALVASVPLDCGSHTHTVYPSPTDDNILYLYNSSYPLGDAAVTTKIEADTTQVPMRRAGEKNDGTDCLEPEPGEAKPNGVHDKISIVRVLLNAPETADDRVPHESGTGWTYTHVIERPLDGATRKTDRTSAGRHFTFSACHDINFFVELEMAAAACWDEGQFWDMSNPEAPDFLRRVRNNEVSDLFHSATFTWDGKYVAFEDEAGGGGDDRCRDEDDLQGRMWFYRVKGARLVSSFKIPRPQEKPQTCTAHNYNFIPTNDGKYVMASAWYQGGTSMIDFTDVENPEEVGFYDANSPIVDGGPNVISNAWSSYWYNGYVHVNDISRGYEVYSFDRPDLTANAQTLDWLNPQVQHDLIAQTYRFASRITLNKNGKRWSGRVSSEDERCVAGRTVRLKKARTGRPDLTVRTTTTNETGGYRVRYKANKGRYYAQVARSSFAEDINTVVCQGARSRTIRVR
jgi:LVIVD repeat